MTTDKRLFVYVAATGIAYCDRSREEHGDYVQLGLLPFKTLEPEIRKDCPDDLRAEIVDHMATIQAKRGEDFQVSTSGQSIRLGA